MQSMKLSKILRNDGDLALQNAANKSLCVSAQLAGRAHSTTPPWGKNIPANTNICTSDRIFLLI